MAPETPTDHAPDCDCLECYVGLPVPWGWRKADFYEYGETIGVHYLLTGNVPINGVMGPKSADPHGESFAWMVFVVLITAAAMAITQTAPAAQEGAPQP